MNNKGQVFILFIILIPIIVFVFINLIISSYRRININLIDKSIYDNLNIMIKNDDMNIDKLKNVLSKNMDVVNVLNKDNNIYIDIKFNDRIYKYCLIDERIKKEGECL